MEEPIWKTNGIRNNNGNVLIRELLQSQAANQTSRKRRKRKSGPHRHLKLRPKKTNKRAWNWKLVTLTRIKLKRLKFEHKLGLIYKSLISTSVLNAYLATNIKCIITKQPQLES